MCYGGVASSPGNVYLTRHSPKNAERGGVLWLRTHRNTLVCDSVAEAKRLAFMGPERHKVGRGIVRVARYTMACFAGCGTLAGAPGDASTSSPSALAAIDVMN